MSLNSTTAMVTSTQVTNTIAILNLLLERFVNHLPLIFVILGLVGFIGNALTFIQTELRSNTCCLYLLLGSIIDATVLLFNTLPLYLTSRYKIDANLSWNFATNITEANEKILIAQSLIRAPFSELALPIAKLFNEHMKYSKNDDLRYIFGRLALGVNSNNTEDATAKVCEPNDSNKCYTLAPYLERLMQIEKDYDRLIWAWKGWHDGCGNQVHPVYLSYVDLLNKNVKENG
ncbi:unnamed protein product [Rotaria sp. Silwood2]|nr:unnamed protein product [Rotaria sp. Silwood2]CAF4294701.1 unnamed protein product [Rotaria sp. Silwood2]